MKQGYTYSYLKKYSSAKPGQKIAIMGGVHGNEKSGVMAIQDVITCFESGKLKVLKGEVCFVLANLLAIDQNKRCIDADLNSNFLPISSLKDKQNVEEIIGSDLGQLLKEYDLLIDIHDANELPDGKSFILGNPKVAELLSESDLAFCIRRGSTEEQEKSSSLYLNAPTRMSASRMMWHLNKIGAVVEVGTFDQPDSVKAQNMITTVLSKSGILASEALLNQLSSIKIQNIITRVLSRLGRYILPSTLEEYDWKGRYNYRAGEFVIYEKWSNFNDIKPGDVIGENTATGEKFTVDLEGKILFISRGKKELEKGYPITFSLIEKVKNEQNDDWTSRPGSENPTSLRFTEYGQW